MIDCLEKGFSISSSDSDAQREFEQGFTNFFVKLQQSEGLTLTKEQLERLHQLVEKFVDLSYVSSLPYRRTLLNIPEKKQ